MSRLVEGAIFAGAIAMGLTLVIKVVGDAETQGIKARHDAELDRACTLAAGSVRSTLSWLAPDHPRREAGLLLLSRDAAWAPVCARDRGAGAELRSQIDDALGQRDAPGAVSLASQLVVLLENR